MFVVASRVKTASCNDLVKRFAKAHAMLIVLPARSRHVFGDSQLKRDGRELRDVTWTTMDTVWRSQSWWLVQEGFHSVLQRSGSRPWRTSASWGDD